jgi:hypothetical protein
MGGPMSRTSSWMLCCALLLLAAALLTQCGGKDTTVAVGLCTDGDVRSCGISNLGACKFGTQACGGGTWGTCIGAVNPTTETCDNIDNDCNGSVDDGFPRPVTNGTWSCNAGSSTVNCNPSYYDCDGVPDNGCESSSTCPVLKSNGSVCGVGSECLSGNCTDSYCCDTDCAGLCQSCALGGSFGTCTVIAPNTDPDGECGGFFCSGSFSCYTSCASDTECKAFYYCTSGSVCAAKKPAGAGCTLDNECVSNVCQSLICQ